MKRKKRMDTLSNREVKDYFELRKKCSKQTNKEYLNRGNGKKKVEKYRKLLKKNIKRLS